MKIHWRRRFRTHAIDVLARGTAINWPRYQALAASPNSGLQAITVDSYAYDHIDFNLHNPILADVDVRRALIYATNRPEIIAKIMPARIPPRTVLSIRRFHGATPRTRRIIRSIRPRRAPCSTRTVGVSGPTACG